MALPASDWNPDIFPCIEFDLHRDDGTGGSSRPIHPRW